MPEAHVFITEDQAAVFLQVSLSTLRRWRKQKTGPQHFRLGNIIRYSKAELLAFISRNSSEADARAVSAA